MSTGVVMLVEALRRCLPVVQSLVRGELHELVYSWDLHAWLCRSTRQVLDQHDQHARCSHQHDRCPTLRLLPVTGADAGALQCLQTGPAAALAARQVI